MERLYAAFARAGSGWIMVSDFPAKLRRNPVDTALLIPNQPILSRSPRVEAPLLLKRPACFVREGCAFEPDWLPDEDREAVDHIYEELKKSPAVLAQMEAVIERKAEADVPTFTSHRDAVVAEVKVSLRRRAKEGARGYLSGDFPITLYRGPTVTVAQILANSNHYRGRLTLTPGEDDYRGGAQTGKIYVSDRGVKLHTRAHGGKTYGLLTFYPDKTIRSLLGGQDPTGPLPPEEAKRLLRQELATWPGKVVSLGIKATQGLGKTHEVLSRMAEESEQKFLFLAANLMQCQQVYDEYCAQYGGHDAVLCRGRGAPDPDTEEALMCTQPLRCEEALARGATRLSIAACRSCPHFDSCGYQKQVKRLGRKKTAPRVIFAAHDYAHFPLPGGWEPDAVIIDEMLRTACVDEGVCTPDSGLTLADRLDPANAIVAHEMAGLDLDRTDVTAVRAYRYRGEVLQAMAAGRPTYVLNKMWTAPRYREFARNDKPVLVIDGTLRQDLLELQLARKFEVRFIVARRNMVLVQVIGNDAGSRATKVAFTKMASEPVERYLNNLPRDLCLFTYKAVRGLLRRDDDPACCHFLGDIRGSNRFKDYQTALIYGRLQIPQAVAFGRAQVLAEANGQSPPGGKMEWVKRTVTIRSYCPMGGTSDGSELYRTRFTRPWMVQM